MSIFLHVYTGHAKKSIPEQNFANFSKTIARYDIIFYTLVPHSIVRKF